MNDMLDDEALAHQIFLEQERDMRRANEEIVAFVDRAGKAETTYGEAREIKEALRMFGVDI